MASPLIPPVFRADLPLYPQLTQVLRVTAGVVSGPTGVAQVAGSSVLAPILYVAFTQQTRDDGSLLPRDREPCLVADRSGRGLTPGFYLGRLSGSWTALPVYEVAGASASVSSSTAATITNLTTANIIFIESSNPGVPPSGFAYLYVNTSGQLVFINDLGVTKNLSATISGASQIACRVYRSTTLTTNSNTNTGVSFDAKRYDTGDSFFEVGVDSRIVIPSEGVYAVGATVMSESGHGGVGCVQLKLVKTGGTDVDIAGAIVPVGADVSGSDRVWLTVHSEWHFDATQELAVEVGNSTDAAVNFELVECWAHKINDQAANPDP